MSYDLVDAKPIHELCKIIDCEHKTAPYVEESEFLVVRTSNVRNGQLVMEDMKFTTEEGFVEWTQRAIPEYGDVLFTREAPAGESCLVPQDKKICMGQRMVLLRPNRETVDPLFLSLILATEKCKFDIYRLSIGSTVSRINISDIKNLKVASPPLPEQQKIAQILSTWDQAISATEKLLENSQQQKKALMQQLLTGKKRLLDENGVRFGEGWTICMLEELEQRGWAELSRGKVISKVDIQEIPGDYPIYSSSVKNNGLMGYYGEYMFDEELISWSVDGGGDFFYRPKHKFSITNVSGYMRLDTAKLCYQFIANQLQLLHSKLEFDYQSKAHPSVIRKLYKLSIPSIEEQKKIAEVLSLADQEIEILQKKLDCLKQEKKALMQQLLTGKKRVKVAA